MEGYRCEGISAVGSPHCIPRYIKTNGSPVNMINFIGSIFKKMVIFFRAVNRLATLSRTLGVQQ